MSAIRLILRLAEHCADVVDALAWRDVAIVEIVVLVQRDCSGAGNRQIFIPFHRHVVPSAVTAIFLDMLYVRHGAVSVGIYGDGGVVALRVLLLGLEDAVGLAAWMHKFVLSPMVGNGFVFPKRAVRGHLAAIDVA